MPGHPHKDRGGAGGGSPGQHASVTALPLNRHARWAPRYWTGTSMTLGASAALPQLQRLLKNSGYTRAEDVHCLEQGAQTMAASRGTEHQGVIAGCDVWWASLPSYGVQTQVASCYGAREQ